ncbi:MAG: sigma 54-interacting transcriptional regulator [Deltaproteobacteria bacterium]
MDGRTLPVISGRTQVPSLQIEVIDGPDRGRVVAAEGETLDVGTADGNDAVLKDPTVSRFHLQLVLHGDGIRVTDQGSTNGTHVGAVRIERAVVPPGTAVRIGHTTLRVGRGGDVTVELIEGSTLAGLVGGSPAMQRLFALVQRAAQSERSVLVVGESGTGKEIIARALHDLGPRAAKPFVTVDCGALSPTLVASELFGHERGAFTGADRQHAGAFERADEGTIFLDEIGELPAALQATLLGVIERRRFRRLGGSREISTNVRVVSATHRDLRADVNSNAFRLDLYYRLAVVVLQVPPLRERAEDIPRLVEHFLRECGHDGPVETLLSPQAMTALQAHRWPGNVRELRNLVEATVAMGEAPAIARDLGATPVDVSAADPQGESLAPLLRLPYKEARAALLNGFEKQYLAKLLERTDGNVSRAAREASLDRSHLTDLIRRHGLR